MENCKNCFLAASCAAIETVDPNATEKHWNECRQIAHYEDENRRLKKMMRQAYFLLREYPRCAFCSKQNSLSCESCGRHYANFKLAFADEYNKIMFRE